MRKRILPLNENISTTAFLVLGIFSLICPIIIFLFIGELYIIGSLISFVIIGSSLLILICEMFSGFSITFCENSVIISQKPEEYEGKLLSNKCKINYNSIEDVRLIHTIKNVNKRTVYDKSGNVGKDCQLFLEFTLKDEDTKWFDFCFFSDKQRVKIIELINAKTGLSKSYNQLVRELLAPQVDGKIDLK